MITDTKLFQNGPFKRFIRAHRSCPDHYPGRASSGIDIPSTSFDLSSRQSIAAHMPNHSILFNLLWAIRYSNW